MVRREPQTRTRHIAENLGPACVHCNTDEARCAFVRGCCRSCSHYHWLDAAGNELNPGVSGRRRTICDLCRRTRRACTHKAA